MRRFVYTPDVNAYVATQDNEFIDLSPDIISGSVTRRINAMSSADLTLQNPNRKYLKKMKAMDRIVIYLTRIHRPVLVFSGYLDRAPYDQLYPGPVKITASCSLKRLMHTYWDPGLPFVTRWLAQYGWTYDFNSGMMLDPSKNLYNMDYSGGLGHMLRAVMHDVGGWPIGYKSDHGKNSVHVMALPKKFTDVAKKLFTAERDQSQFEEQVVSKIIDTLMTVDGVYTGPSGSSPSTLQIVDNTTDDNALPKDTANQNWKASIYGEKVLSQGPIDAARIDAYLATKNSPLAGQGQNMVDAGNTYHIDPRLFVAIAGAETSFGTVGSGPAVYNAWGMFDSHSNNIAYSSWADGINAVAKNIAGPLYFGKGAFTIEQIGAIWAPVGASNDPSGLNNNWVKNVSQYYTDLGGNAANSVKLSNDTTQKDQQPQGSIGDVKASNPAFFSRTQGSHGDTSSGDGYTFRIKDNPFGDDTLIFRAIYDNGIPADTIKIYVPGAANKGTPWAQNWTDHIVTLDTSYGQNPFPTSGSTSTANSIPVVNMTPQQAVGVGGALDQWDAMKPVAKAGMKFIQQQFGPLTMTAGYAASGHAAGGEHPMGLAVDIVPTGGWTKDARQRMYALAAWAGWRQDCGSTGCALDDASSQPNAKPVAGNNAVRFVGWDGYPNHGWGNHMHISFIGSVQPADVATSSSSTTTNVTVGTGGTSGSYGSYGTDTQLTPNQVAQIATTAAYGFQLGFPAVADATLSQVLTGERALANDVPLFEWVEFICKASGRNFQSMPNGDFFAYYPDYFNWTGETPYFSINPIEIIDLNIDVGDEELTTHVFATGDVAGFDNNIDLYDRIQSQVASVENIAAFSQLVNIDKTKFDVPKFLGRYGARPLSVDRPEIKNPLLLYMYAWRTFLDQWAKQFYCDAQFSFLPELFPGGIVEIAGHDLVMYVNEVTHSFDRSGGFSTDASLIAPSSKSKTGENPSMVLANPTINTNPSRR